MLPQRWQYIPIIVMAWRYAVALLGAVGLAALYQASGRSVEVVVDGRRLSLHTHARTSGAVLRELGILPRDHDALSPSASIALVGSATTVEFRTAHPVLIQAPSGTFWQASPDLQVENILDAAGGLLYPGDLVLVNGLRPRHRAARRGDAPRLIQLRNGHPIELRIDGVPNTIYSAAPTLGEALWENGIRLYEGDAIRPGPESGLSGPLQAEITRSRPLHIALAGGAETSRPAVRRPPSAKPWLSRESPSSAWTTACPTRPSRCPPMGRYGWYGCWKSSRSSSNRCPSPRPTSLSTLWRSINAAWSRPEPMRSLPGGSG